MYRAPVAGLGRPMHLSTDLDETSCLRLALRYVSVQ
jgi:hypothetical protein